MTLVRTLGSARYRSLHSILPWKSIRSAGRKEQGETQSSRRPHGERGEEELKKGEILRFAQNDHPIRMVRGILRRPAGPCGAHKARFALQNNTRRQGLFLQGGGPVEDDGDGSRG